MIVSVSGYGGTGSSAVIDLIREYEEISYPCGTEFELLYIPGGILNIDSFLNDVTPRFHLCDSALSQFRKIIDNSKRKENPFYKFTGGKFYKIADDYFNSICQAQWDGIVSYDHYIYSRINIIWRYAFVRRINNLLGTNLSNKLKINYMRKMYFSVKPDNFVEKTKKFFSDIFDCVGYEPGKIKLINQLFPANCVERCYKYFDDESKTIVVMRDPRDIYMSCKYLWKHEYFAPVEINDFVTYIKKLYGQKEKNENIKYIYFEDLIFNYDKTVSEIEKFLSINRHINKNKYFNSSISIGNTQLFKRMSCNQKEINKIENELKDYLYDFPNDDIDYSVGIYEPPEDGYENN